MIISIFYDDILWMCHKLKKKSYYLQVFLGYQYDKQLLLDTCSNISLISVVHNSIEIKTRRLLTAMKFQGTK